MEGQRVRKDSGRSRPDVRLFRSVGYPAPEQAHVQGPDMGQAPKYYGGKETPQGSSRKIPQGGEMKKLLRDYKKLSLAERICLPVGYVLFLAAYWWLSGILR